MTKISLEDAIFIEGLFLKYGKVSISSMQKELKFPYLKAKWIKDNVRTQTQLKNLINN